MKIYDEYTSKVKSAALTNSVAKFVERLCAKMGIRSLNFDIGTTTAMRQNDSEIMGILREETQFVMMLVREIIEAKKEERVANNRI